MLRLLLDGLSAEAGGWLGLAAPAAAAAEAGGAGGGEGATWFAGATTSGDSSPKSPGIIPLHLTAAPLCFGRHL